MSFQFSPDIDKNKIFLVNRSELEERLDPEYYKLFYKEMVHKVKSANKTDCLYKIADVLHGFTPAKNDYSKDKTIYPIIKVSSYVDDFIDLSKTAHTKKPNISNAVNGDVYILSSAHQSEYVGRFIKYLDEKPDKNTGFVGEFLCVRAFKQYQKYLFVILNTDIYKTLINREKRGQTSHIYPSDIKKIEIPILPKEIQAEIIEKIDFAYTSRQQKEAEAKQLLDSIDHYLFGELGIELPKKEENTLQNRIFTRQLSEVSGGRFDPFFHLLNQQDKLGKYKFYKLKKIANIKKGNSITSDSITNGNIPVIAGGQTSPYSHNIANSEGNVITVSASGAYSGYIWYHKNPIFASDCTIISSNLQYNLQIKYLFEYLKSQQQYIYNLQQGSGQPHVYPADLEKIKIPLPPLEKQTEIANHITEIRNQAKLLQQEAKAGLKQAKKEVEAIILGE